MTTGRQSARGRLLDSAARLLVDAHGDAVSTRAICELAEVGAPTLYHHFGDKQGLLDAVVSHGFDEYLSRKRSHAGSGDPVADIRAGWDDHVEFGRENPVFYALMYGQVRPGRQPPAAREAEVMLTALFRGVADAGRLLTTPARATTRLLAANVGITLAMISRPPAQPWDEDASTAVRDAVLDSLVRGDPRDGEESPRLGVAAAATALSDALHRKNAPLGDPVLEDEEAALLGWWLQRLTAGPA